MDRSRVLIAGAGPVGSAMGLLLLENGFAPSEIQLVDPRDALEAEQDPRFIAVSESSRRLLERLGGWPRDASCPIHQIHVSHRGRFGRTLIDEADYGLPALGHVVRYGDLVGSLNRATAAAGVDIKRGAQAIRSRLSEDHVQVELQGGQALESGYVIHAEGGVFDAQKAQSIRRTYDQTAVCAFVTCAHPRPGVAFERFTESGPIALLPAANKQGLVGLSLVWCCTPADAARRLALDEPGFLEALHRNFGDRLGRFIDVGPRFCFPLGLNAVRQVARLREFAIGNAAQTLHPVAGQGLNLGLRDATTLARVLGAQFDAPRVCAQRYEAARRRDRAATLGLTDLLPRAFKSRVLPVAALRSATLLFLDLMPPARELFARQMIDGQR